MKLWLLKRRQDLPGNDNPWMPEYDKNHGLVIRAETEDRARQIAQDNAANENEATELRQDFPGQVFVVRTYDAWLNAKYSTCVELTVNGEEGVIIADYLAS